VKKAAK